MSLGARLRNRTRPVTILMKINNFSLLFLLLPVGLGAQEVQARFAQNLVTVTMAAHPELQKMGLHVVPPGGADDVIVACSVPTKIGKKSSPADLEVEHSGKAAVKTNTAESFYDLALPLKDSNGRAIGLTVMEMKFSGATSADDAVQKAEVIENGLERQVSSLSALFAEAPSSAPVVLLRSTPLPDIQGDFDHFAVNSADNRLYVSAEVHHSIEVFNLHTGEHLQSVPGVTTPHTLAFDVPSKRLFVADGDDNSCRILEGQDLHEVARIPLEPGPDAGVYDPDARIFYVGNGGRKAKQTYSFITLISTADSKEIGRIRLESSNLEAMSIDHAKKLLYVNLRDRGQIGVVDLQKKEVREVWSIPGLNLNTPMQFDSQNRRLFVAGRKPGKLSIINTDTGQLITTMDCIETADDMIFDPRDRRIYISGSGGLTIIRQQGADSYKTLEQFPTNAGKTSALVPQLAQLYVIHTKTPEDKAALQVYKVNE